MAHFAKINESNIVTQVVVVNDSDGNNDTNGQNFLNDLFKTTHTWKKTSYNTYGNTHRLGGTPYRKNFASVGFVYDEEKDAFIPPKPLESYVLDEDKCEWYPPITQPQLTEGQTGMYVWNEEAYQNDNTQGWEYFDYS